MPHQKLSGSSPKSATAASDEDRGEVHGRRPRHPWLAGSQRLLTPATRLCGREKRTFLGEGRPARDAVVGSLSCEKLRCVHSQNSHITS